MTILTEFFHEVLQGPLLLLVAAAATAYAGVLARKLNAWIGLENEALLRDALHKAAESAIRFALAKAGPGTDVDRAGQILSVARDFVRDKNPATVAKLGIDDDTLNDILMSKAGLISKTGGAR